MRTVLSLLLLMTFATTAAAGSDLAVEISASDINGSIELGKVPVEGTGQVSLTASKSGVQVVIHAEKADGTVIGKAETVVGLKQTPIYVMTDDGLKKITIFWGAD